MPELRLGETPVDLIRKDIKHLYLRVLPPSGRVRISAPRRTSMRSIRAFLDSRRDWIEKHRSRLRAQDAEPALRYLDGEIHLVWGEPYRLSVGERDDSPTIGLKHGQMLLRVRPGADLERRRAVVETWYRGEIQRAVPPLLARWQPRMGVEIERFFVRRMKTRWGSCTPAARTMRLNAELAKRPPACLEYVVVHELAHLIEPTHGTRFYRLMDRFLPGWASQRQELNARPCPDPERR